MLTINNCVRNGRAVMDPTGGLFTVVFPGGSKYFYKTLQAANVGRLWMDALKNVPKTNKRSKNGWADLARYLDMAQPPLKPNGQPRSRSSMSSGVSNIVFGMAVRGTLPKDRKKLKKLLKLAGEPWLTEFSKEAP